MSFIIVFRAFSSTRRPPCSLKHHCTAGSFGATVETAILPALTGMAAAIDDGQNHLEALASTVPALLNASSLAMPCRAMCEVRCPGRLGAGTVPCAPLLLGHKRQAAATATWWHPVCSLC